MCRREQTDGRDLVGHRRYLIDSHFQDQTIFIEVSTGVLEVFTRAEILTGLHEHPAILEEIVDHLTLGDFERGAAIPAFPCLVEPPGGGFR